MEMVIAGQNPEARGSQASRIHLTVAARGPMRYCLISHSDAFFPEDLDWNENAVYFTGETLDVYYPSLGYYETSRKNAHTPYAWKVKSAFLWECLGWWPPDDDSKIPDQGRTFFLHTALAQKGYGVLPRQELVDGVWCHVVELPGVDKLWLDPARGFALLRRERFTGTPPVPTFRYELSDYREVAPAVWLPYKLRRVIFAAHKSGETSPRIQMDATGTVVDAEVNQVPEDFFQFTPPPGTLVQDRDTRQMTQIPGGLAILDAITDKALARLTLAASHRPGAVSVSAPAWQGYAWGGVILALVALSACLVKGALAELRWGGPGGRPAGTPSS
jgi:hypothetical protein